MMVDIFREVLCSDQETGRFEKKPGELIGRYANGLYEHSCSVFIFVNMSSDQFCHTSSEYFTKHRWQGEVSFSLAGISLLLKSCFAASNLTDTSKTGPRAKLGNTSSFYRGLTNALPAALKQLKLA